MITKKQARKDDLEALVKLVVKAQVECAKAHTKLREATEDLGIVAAKLLEMKEER